MVRKFTRQELDQLASALDDLCDSLKATFGVRHIEPDCVFHDSFGDLIMTIDGLLDDEYYDYKNRQSSKDEREARKELLAD